MEHSYAQYLLSGFKESEGTAHSLIFFDLSWIKLLVIWNITTTQYIIKIYQYIQTSNNICRYIEAYHTKIKNIFFQFCKQNHGLLFVEKFHELSAASKRYNTNETGYLEKLPESMKYECISENLCREWTINIIRVCITFIVKHKQLVK